MKKLFLGLVVMLSHGLFGVENAKAIDNPSNSENICVTTSAEATVEIWNVEYKGDKIIVTVRLCTETNTRSSFRVKITPTREILEAIVEAQQYVDINAGDDWGKCKEGKVTFNCSASKNGDAAYCKRYDFTAEIIR